MTRIEAKPETMSQLRKRLGLMSIREVALSWGVDYLQAWKAVQRDESPKPTTQFGSGTRLYYLQSDLPAVKAHFQSLGLME